MIPSEQFSDEFRIHPKALGVPSEATCITEVKCPDEWIAPGSTLIHSRQSLYTIWDGVFFELRRD